MVFTVAIARAQQQQLVHFSLSLPAPAGGLVASAITSTSTFYFFISFYFSVGTCNQLFAVCLCFKTYFITFCFTQTLHTHAHIFFCSLSARFGVDKKRLEIGDWRHQHHTTHTHARRKGSLQIFSSIAAFRWICEFAASWIESLFYLFFVSPPTGEAACSRGGLGPAGQRAVGAGGHKHALKMHFVSTGSFLGSAALGDCCSSVCLSSCHVSNGAVRRRIRLTYLISTACALLYLYLCIFSICTHTHDASICFPP